MSLWLVTAAMYPEARMLATRMVPAARWTAALVGGVSWLGMRFFWCSPASAR